VRGSGSEEKTCADGGEESVCEGRSAAGSIKRDRVAHMGAR
jgi:hypothetical protein